MTERIFQSLERRRSRNDPNHSHLTWPAILAKLGPSGRAGELRTDADLAALPADLKALRAVGVFEGGAAVVRWVDTEAVPVLEGVELHHQHIGTNADGRSSFIREGYVYPHQVPARPAVTTTPSAPPPPRAEESEVAIARLGAEDPAKLLAALRPRFRAGPLPTPLAAGTPASPGAVSGVLCLSAEDVAKAGARPAILAIDELRPDDPVDLAKVAGLVVFRGGYSSHAAVVARERKLPCINFGGVEGVKLRPDALVAGGVELAAGAEVALDGGAGRLYGEAIEVLPATRDPRLRALVDAAQREATIRIHANADTAPQVADAIGRGAVGIGLCRSEHMFLEPERRRLLQTLLVAAPGELPAGALASFVATQTAEFAEILRAAKGLPVKLRLLDPPSHEFLPEAGPDVVALAERLGISSAEVMRRIEAERETNPMLGRRGVRLGQARPEIYRAQIEAIARAAASVKAEGSAVDATVVVPMVSRLEELLFVKSMLAEVCAEVPAAPKLKLGVMIEVPSAALEAGALAEHCDSFSIGSNDLTQMTLGISRDDQARLPRGSGPDPFRSLALESVGKLVLVAAALGRDANPKLEVGLCGAHAEDPASLAFLRDKAKLDLASVPPPSVEASWLHARAAARADALENGRVGGLIALRAGTLEIKPNGKALGVLRSPTAAADGAASPGSPLAVETAAPTLPAEAPVEAAAPRLPEGTAVKIRAALKPTRPEPPQHSRSFAEIVAASSGEAGFVPFAEPERFFAQISPALAQRERWIRVVYGRFPEGEGFRFATDKALLWAMADAGHQGMDPERKKVREGYVRIDHEGRGIETMSR